MQYRLKISERAGQWRLPVFLWSLRLDTFWPELKTFKYAIWPQVVDDVLKIDLFQIAFCYPLWLSQLV